MTPNNDWTPALTQRLVDLFHTRISFSHIAAELGVSRNAAIAKCNRLGLKRNLPLRKPFQHVMRHPKQSLQESRQHNYGGRAGKIRRSTAPDFLREETLPQPDPLDLATPRKQRKTVATLLPRDCRFYIGDPQCQSAAGGFFCGAPRFHNLPYCERHARRCYHPAKGA